MTFEEHEKHKRRHYKLHRMFDELLADFIDHTHKTPSKATLMELIKWSAQQKENPTELSE